jgi:hypothetical protein
MHLRLTGSIPGNSTGRAADERPFFFDSGPHINIYEYRDGGVSAKSCGRAEPDSHPRTSNLTSKLKRCNARALASATGKWRMFTLIPAVPGPNITAPYPTPLVLKPGCGERIVAEDWYGTNFDAT